MLWRRDKSRTSVGNRTKITWTSSPSPALHIDYTVLASDIFRSVMKGFVQERQQVGVALIALKTLGEISETVCTQRTTWDTRCSRRWVWVSSGMGRRDLVEMCWRFEEIFLQLQAWRYCSSEKLVNFCHIIRYHTPEDSNLQKNMYEFSTLEPTCNC
jgi:hypothetical protein